MVHNAPGKRFRKGMSLIEIARMFPDDAAAERWFARIRWPDGPRCPSCGSANVQDRATRKPQPYRCRDCRRDFSVRTGTLMQGSKLGFQVWAIAIYLLATNLKGVSSLKLHRDLGVTQKTAWYLAQRIRETWNDDMAPFSGPVEADETCIGGKRRNMPWSRRRQLTGRGTAAKTAVVGATDRRIGQVNARVMQDTTAEALQGLVAAATLPDAVVYTDDARAYRGMDCEHEAVRHSVGEYVRGMAHTNGIESFWSMLKRGCYGTYRCMSEKHLGAATWPSSRDGTTSAPPIRSGRWNRRSPD